MFSAVTDSLRGGLRPSAVRGDILAGLTVGVIALPLSMALAIASGVAPQHGLYTAIVAGIVVALSGGSRVNISGPTAAFVVVLLPITQTYGLGGLLLAGMLSGVILVALGLARLGKLIAVVPYPVTIGFTAGIGTVIALLQIPELLGLGLGPLDGSLPEKVTRIAAGLGGLRWEDTLIGLLTFAILLGWGRLKSRIPGHLIALLAGTLLALLLGWASDGGFQVATIGSRFEYLLDGETLPGIPPLPPQPLLPWHLPGPDGTPIGLSFELLRALIAPAFAIAMLGALESLLCATVADGLSGGRHNPNDELIGQGLGNLAVPFFGGIPATAAIARTAANVRAGAGSPLASVVHAMFILLAIASLAPALAHIPMAAMAALLLMVAWNMSEARHFMRILRGAPRGDVATLLTCFGLTVLVSMEIAVAVGMGLAAVLFIRRTIELTQIQLVEPAQHPHAAQLPNDVLIYDINGPLFFGAAQKALSALTSVRPEVRAIILDCSDVTLMDLTAMVAMESIAANLRQRGVKLVINGLAPRMLLKLRRYGIRRRRGELEFARSIAQATRIALDRSNG
ncbi:C4-dicarboxylic acid transporter DauA [Thiohalocapsa marina]|uniref:C4-dicarboxylic acid transporter DauA n=1 Tax=Thiohalocapsa marina TaxID=424902 RepID=A0A5M8FTC7_9GAMM|nr:C4-dicarboxylic acid transporter DauA [Thiohalocapsa marina]KAA6187048.1 C4-dicarboxylic acid transporter DauA [Thiohalocapsa marina]